jgi:hypothetical protein
LAPDKLADLPGYHVKRRYCALYAITQEQAESNPVAPQPGSAAEVQVTGVRLVRGWNAPTVVVWG